MHLQALLLALQFHRHLYTATLDLHDMADVNRNVRRPLVCEWCRKRKKKCDRRHPCGPCITRGSAATCVFEMPHSILAEPEEDEATGMPPPVRLRAEETRRVVTGQLFQGKSRPSLEYSMPAHWISMLAQSKEFRTKVEEIIRCSMDDTSAIPSTANMANLTRFPSAAAVEILIRTYVEHAHPHFPILDMDEVMELSHAIWVEGKSVPPSFLALMAAMLACAAYLVSENEVDKVVLDLLPLDYLAFDPSLTPRPRDISELLMLLFNDLLDSYDFTMHPDLYTVQALLLRQYYLAVFLGDGERASPQLWMTINLACSIGLHRDGSLYGLPKSAIARREVVLGGIVMLQSTLILFYGKPYIPGSNKNDAHFPGMLPGPSQYAPEYTFPIEQCVLATLTIKIIDKLYGITAADYTVVESLYAEVQKCDAIGSFDEVRDLMWTASSVDCVRSVNFVIHRRLLILLIHRPWAARGFRDATYYKSSIISRDTARDILLFIISPDWLLSPHGHVFEVHLGSILVRASLHALSVLLTAVLMERSSERANIDDDISLITSALSKCDYFARQMPVRTRSYMDLIRSLTELVTSRGITPDSESPIETGGPTDAALGQFTDLSSNGMEEMYWHNLESINWQFMEWFNAELPSL